MDWIQFHKDVDYWFTIMTPEEEKQKVVVVIDGKRFGVEEVNYRTIGGCELVIYAEEIK